MNDTSQRYPFGDGTTEPLYLTNGCCEATHDYAEDLLKAAGIPYAAAGSDPFYPLTKSEEKYIGEHLADVADGYGALLGYSALYQDKKYLMPSIEFGFGFNVEESEAAAYAHALEGEFRPRIEAIGGHVFLSTEDRGVERHVMQVLIPFEYAMEKTSTFEEWVSHLETDLLASELTLQSQVSQSPRL